MLSWVPCAHDRMGLPAGGAGVVLTPIVADTRTNPPLACFTQYKNTHARYPLERLAHWRRRCPPARQGLGQGLGKVPDCLVHGLVMPNKGQHLGGVAGVVA